MTAARKNSQVITRKPFTKKIYGNIRETCIPSGAIEKLLSCCQEIAESSKKHNWPGLSRSEGGMHYPSCHRGVSPSRCLCRSF